MIKRLVKIYNKLLVALKPIKNLFFVRPHRYLERESKIYQKWLTFKFHKHVHFVIGATAVFLIIFFTASFIQNVLAYTAWTQSDWSGGVGSSTTNQYSSASNANTTTANQITLSTNANQISNYNFATNLTGWTAGVQPSDISGLQLWLKANAITGLSNNAAVSSWVDSSGNGNNATQSTSADQPSYETNQINGLPAVNFNGNGDFLVVPSLTGQTIFAVVNHADGTTFTNYRRIVDNGDSFGYSIFGVNGGSQYNPTSLPRGITASNFWVNGANTLSASPLSSNKIISAIATSASTNTNWIGTYTGTGNQTMYGDIAEVIIYNDALSTTQRQSIENYLATKYNISDSGGVTATRNTTTTYNSDAASTQLVAATTGEFTQDVNVGNTNSYNLTAYAYDGGSAVTSSDAQLYYGSNTVSTTYTSVGGGWYELSGSVTGVNALEPVGVQVAAGQTVYVDNFALNNYPSSGSLISNIYNTGLAENWGNLSISDTVPSGAGVNVLVRAGNQSNLSDAPAFTSCSAIASGSSITSSCAPNKSQYVQYEFQFTSNGSVTPTVTSVSIPYTPSDTTPPTTNASSILAYRSNGGASISSDGWSNTDPYFTWTAGVDNTGGSGIQGYCLYLGQDPTGNPVTTKGDLGTSPLNTGGTCQFAVSSTSVDTSLSGYIGTALTSSTNPYYLNIKAIDNADNVYNGSSAQFEFMYDNVAPTNPSFITAPSEFVSDKQVTLTWPTTGSDAASDDNSGVAGLQYRIGSSGTWYGANHSGTQDASDLLSNNGSYTTVSNPDFSNLQQGNNIVYFRTWDNAGNVSQAYVTTVIKINSTAPSSPQNLTATPTTNTTNSFGFSWLAPATYTGSASNITYCYTVNVLPTSSNCTFTAAGQTSLDAGAYATEPGDNTFYLVAKDEAGNINYATAASATFTANTPAPGVPLNPDIADISIKSTDTWKLALSWNEPSTVGAGIATYKIFRSTDDSNFTNVASTAGTSYVDANLNQQTYYYKVEACDSANNCGGFTDVFSALPTGKFTSPANLIDGPSVTTSTRTATISWITDRDSDSRVEYGLSTGQYSSTEAANSDQVVSHTITLDNLQAGTTYYYRSQWDDVDGNLGTSPEASFTTLPAPTVSNVNVSNVNLHDGTINFTTKGASSVKLYYGTSSGFGSIDNLNTSTTSSSYSINLSSLTSGTTYYYKIDTIDAYGNEYNTGQIDTFATPPQPTITNVEFQPVAGALTGTEQISWTTNVPATSQISYGLLNGDRQNQLGTTLTTNHTMTISDLSYNTEYSVTATSVDELGNSASSDLQVFKSGIDTRPPVISQVTIQPSIVGTGADAKGQLIVSWKTDKAGTSQVAYGEGTSGDYSTKTAENAALVNNHVVVVSGLSTSQVYHLQVISDDADGIKGVSSDQTTIIGQASDNALGIVFNALQSIFGL